MPSSKVQAVTRANLVNLLLKCAFLHIRRGVHVDYYINLSVWGEEHICRAIIVHANINKPNSRRVLDFFRVVLPWMKFASMKQEVVSLLAWSGWWFSNTSFPSLAQKLVTFVAISILAVPTNSAGSCFFDG